LTPEEFEQLIGQREGETLDFKTARAAWWGFPTLRGSKRGSSISCERAAPWT
jgi:hypothetical protein